MGCFGKVGQGHGTRGTGERKEVTLTFDGIGYAPKDVSAWLVDTVTGKRSTFGRKRPTALHLQSGRQSDGSKSSWNRGMNDRCGLSG